MDYFCGNEALKTNEAFLGGNDRDNLPQCPRGTCVVKLDKTWFISDQCRNGSALCQFLKINSLFGKRKPHHFGQLLEEAGGLHGAAPLSDLRDLQHTSLQNTQLPAEDDYGWHIQRKLQVEMYILQGRKITSYQHDYC